MEKKCGNCQVKNLPMFDITLCDKCEDNPNYKSQTNRQWLDSLSDEDRAKESIKSRCERCDYYNPNCECNPLNNDICIEGNLMWLQAEHKE